jgi:excisionase family DNA binding protein
MNPTTWTIYREYLDKTGNDAVAASLALADTLQSTLDARQSESERPAGEALVLTAKQAAVRLSVSIRTIYDLADSGQLPCQRIGKGRGTLRFRHEDVENFTLPDRPRASVPVASRSSREAAPVLATSTVMSSGIVRRH